jgi:transposase
MARSRISMKALRSVIELHCRSGLSQRQISKATGVSRPVVAQEIAAFIQSGLSLEEFAGLPDAQAVDCLSALKPGSAGRSAALLTFFLYMIKELPRTGVTREVLWQEYKAKHPDGYEYSQFCHHFRRWCDTETEVTMTMEHKAGDLMYVDFAGSRPSYREGKVEREAELFVAILGASQYTYAEAVRSQSKEDFIMANLNALYYFGGVPAAIMPDCLKSAVTKADKYESEINSDYLEFARHHGTVIFPARPYHPKDKSLVEGAVKILYTRILAPLRNQQFSSLEALNEAIWELLDSHNQKPFQKLPYSRAELFESIDKPALKPLPTYRYQYTHFKPATVAFNYHVEIRADNHFYSVPYRFARKPVTVAITGRTVEIYHGNERIAFHVRAYHPGYTTLAEHRPANHRFVLEWTPERIIAWAGELSVNVKRLVAIILEAAEYPDQAFRSCIGIINLSKKHPLANVDMAARIALSEQRPNYRAIKKLLEDGRVQVAVDDELKQTILPFHENLRGQAAYK